MAISTGRSRRGATPWLLASALLAATATGADAQEAQQAEAPVTPDRPTMSDFGKDLDDGEAGALLAQMNDLLTQALEASREAEGAGSVAEVKEGAARVVEVIWGIDPGVSGAEASDVERLGWKERWQVSGAEFDPNFVERLGAEAPRITDPGELGIVGRGRAVRARLEELSDSTSDASGAVRAAAGRALASLNNVIGWTHITRGYKGREVQPRISLTHMWDAPPAFWNSTADTGWLYEAEAQAINILKTDYGTELDMAREHAAAMTQLLQDAMQGHDADESGSVEPVRMEGGLAAAVNEAAEAGLRSR